MVMEIDGHFGEGGGQILRSALTLSMCTGVPVKLSNIRAGRRKSGLMRQHLAAVLAAATICNGEVEGAVLNSTTVEFRPGEVVSGDYSFAIGSAGSTTLLVQTVLPALARAPGSSTLSVQGGTHNGMAPSTDFMELAFMPCMRKLGMEVSADLQRHGFYPNGGGIWRLEVGEWRPARLELRERGSPVAEKLVVKIANIGRHVAERELVRVKKKLRMADEHCEIVEPAANGAGNIVSIRLEFTQLTEVFEAVGALGVSAERVAGRAAGAARDYLAQDFPVGVHLADQLLVPMVLGNGGAFVTGSLSPHARTNIAVIEQFLGPGIVSVQENKGRTELTVHAP